MTNKLSLRNFGRFLSLMALMAAFCWLSPQDVRAFDAVDTAILQIGKPYVWGEKGPDEFDCSGLVQYSYGQEGITLPAGSSDQALEGVQVSAPFVRGDLLFFATDDNQPGVVTHVGIYEADNMMVNAVSPSLGIRRDDITSTYWAPRILFARRIYSSVKQSDKATTDSAARGNPVQLLGTGLSGTLSSLELNYQGGGYGSNSYHLIILEYQDSSYNRYTRAEHFSTTAKSSAGTSIKKDIWRSNDFSSAVVFNPNKYYGIMLYQHNSKPMGSSSDTFANGCYVKEEPSGQYVSCDASNVSDMNFVLNLKP